MNRISFDFIHSRYTLPFFLTIGVSICTCGQHILLWTVSADIRYFSVKSSPMSNGTFDLKTSTCSVTTWCFSIGIRMVIDHNDFCLSFSNLYRFLFFLGRYFIFMKRQYAFGCARRMTVVLAPVSRQAPSHLSFFFSLKITLTLSSGEHSPKRLRRFWIESFVSFCSVGRNLKVFLHPSCTSVS